MNTSIISNQRDKLTWVTDAVAAIGMAAAIVWGVTTAAQATAGTQAGAGGLYLPVMLIVGMAILRAACLFNAISVGQRHTASAKAETRARVWPHMFGQAPGDRLMLGETVAIGVDRIEDLDGYHARFLPLRSAAVASPLLIALAVAPASWVASVIMLATLLPFGIGMMLAGTAASRAAGRQLEALGRLSGLFVDRIKALPAIVGFHAEDRVLRHLEDATREVAARTIAVLRTAFLSGAVIEFFAALSVALVAVYCGFSLLGLLPFPAPESLTLGQALFALILAPEFYLPMRRLAAAYHDKQIGEAAQEQLALPPAVPSGTMESIGDAPSLAFRDVVIARGDRRIGPFSFSVGAERILAIRGPSGVGKSSLLHAAIGIAPVMSGAISLNGRSMAAGALAGQVGWIGQSVALFPGSLADNIRMARPAASDHEVEEAAGWAGLAPLIDARGQGLALAIDHAGSWLSGGERRRVGLARLLLNDAPLWLLDEPTADLDAQSATIIIDTLRHAMKGRTVLLATHDAALAALADEENILR